MPRAEKMELFLKGEKLKKILLELLPRLASVTDWFEASVASDDTVSLLGVVELLVAAVNERNLLLR